jgi:SRSO17 transposase
LHGLLTPLDRKNGRRIARLAEESRPDGMQRLLTRAQWSADAVRDELQDYVKVQVGDGSAVLGLGETAFERRGNKSAGVGHYYSASAGRFLNSQVGVFLAYQVPGGPATFVDRKLYVPAKQAAPGARPHATKAALALEMVARARRRQLPCSWVAGSDVFGGDVALRKWLEGHGIAYVLGVPPALGSLSSQDRESVTRRMEELMGARGGSWYRPNPRPTLDLFSAEWARLPLYSPPNGPQTRSLLLRRAKRMRNLACFVCNAPQETSLAQLVAVAETQGAMDEAFQVARRWAGLDQYQVRGEEAWYRHITLSMVAHAFLSTTVFSPSYHRADEAMREAAVVSA